MIKLVKTLRKELGPDAIINYTTYLEDNQQDTVVSTIADDINHVVTMAYWDDLDDAEDLFNYYAQLVGDQNKIAVQQIGHHPTDQSASNAPAYPGSQLHRNHVC